MPRYKLTLEYTGTKYSGWQIQKNARTVQGELQRAIAVAVNGAPLELYGSGRTDAGVHALGQVASVRVTCAHDAETLLRALNAQLPDDIRVLRVQEMADAFHARFDARSKTYRYLIRNTPFVGPFERDFVWHVPQPLDVAAMQQAAHSLVGTHDFAAFQSAGSVTSGTLRTLFWSRVALEPGVSVLTLAGPDGLPEPGALLVYEVRGDGFLRHMVRTIVGTLVEVGRGWRAPDSIVQVLASGLREGAGATATPHGLFLVGVDYD